MSENALTCKSPYLSHMFHRELVCHGHPQGQPW